MGAEGPEDTCAGGEPAAQRGSRGRQAVPRGERGPGSPGPQLGCVGTAWSQDLSVCTPAQKVLCLDGLLKVSKPHLLPNSASLDPPTALLGRTTLL